MMSVWALLMGMLGTGGGSNLLDYVSAKHYWQAKAVAITTDAMVAELKTTDKDKAAAVRRLMAARALGELKDPNALPALRKFAESKEMFESHYAQWVIATIEGKELKPPAASAKDTRSDLWLLPATCGAVGQAAPVPAKPMTGEEMAKALASALPEGKAEEALAQINKALVSLAEKIGNVRLYGVTVGVADNVGDRSGYVVVVARGLYDPEAVKTALIENRAKPQMFGQTEVLILEKELAIILASKERLVFLGGPSQAELPIGEMVNAVSTGKGKLGENEAMGKLIKSIDTSAPIWAAAKVSEAYRKAPLLSAFDTLSLVSKQKEGQVDLTLTGQGSDAGKVQQAVTEFNDLMAKGGREASREAERMPALKPMVELIGSIKAQADGTKATATAQIKGDLRNLVGMPMLMLFMRGADIGGEAREVEVRPAPPPPVVPVP